MCTINCPPGRYKESSSNTCELCSGCKTCIENPTKCTSCYANKCVHTDYKCYECLSTGVHQCPDGFWGDNAKNECKPCNIHCSVCTHGD